MRSTQRTRLPVMNWKAVRSCRLLLLLLIPLCAVVVAFVQVRAEEESDSYSETPIDPFDRDHWAFQPIEEVERPQSSAGDAGWRRNPIDDFVFRKLHKRGIRPQQQASRRTLIRRLSFDLTGLPPTPQQTEQFLSDPRPDAYDHLVKRLLGSPQYGERWAQHWLDLARFAETDGFEHDKVRPNAWTYRDWVIQALNDDMPYDEFIRRQIAGDEIYPDDPSAVTATRFCLSGPDMPDINLIEERRHTVLNELTSTVGEVFLGLQIGCAQCHDHKYDPISQGDFYRLRAIFEPAVTLQSNKSLSVLSESFPYQQASHLMIRGDFRRPGPEVRPGVVRVVSEEGFELSSTRSDKSAGLRTALANWLVDRNNPLTARVIVNRVWQHHFGKGLIDTPSDLGVMGAEPSNAELLDWLALNLMEQGWSLKELHRLIVTSATYRQRSRLSEDATTEESRDWSKAIEEDPDADLLSRYPRWRLEGEAIRDAMLASAGQLNLQAGGPGVRPPLPKELVGTLLKNQWNVTKDESEHNRRSVYVFARRNLRYPIFEVFDRPSANASCSGRGSSTTAPQSLHLLNSKFSLDMARQMAESILAAEDDQAAQIDAAFRRTLNRPPSPAELADVGDFLQETDSTREDQLTHLCLSLFNCNEFVTVD